jgi:hypothetical protein
MNKSVKKLIIIGIVLVIVTTIIAVLLNNSIKPDVVDIEIGQNSNPNCTHDENYTEPQPKTGKYYLNGDTENYYFEILEDNKIQLVGNLYEIFSKWNPGKEDIIQEDVKAWSEPRDFTVITMHKGSDKPLIAVDWEFDETGELIKLASGPVMYDENTLTSWGMDGDFIFVE